MSKRLAMIFAIFLVMATTPALGKMKVGDPVPEVTLKDPEGALVKDGNPWSTSSLPGKVHILFYVDPDEKDANEALEEELKKSEFPSENFGSIAMINMGATWLPNGIIGMTLKTKQEKFPRTVYVKDFKKVMVDKWGLVDDAYNVVLIDKAKIVRFLKAGTLNKDEIKLVIDMISEYMAK